MASNEVQYIVQLKDEMSSGLLGINNNVKNLEKNLESVKGHSAGLGNIFKQAIPFVAGFFAVDKIIEFGKGSLEALQHYETFQATLSTFLGGNINAMEELTQVTERFGSSGVFQSPDIQEATRQLLSFGVEAEDVEKSLKLIGDVATGIKAPLSDVAEFFAKSKLKGSVSPLDINLLEKKGVPIMQELKKQFGLNKQGLDDLIQSGAVGFPQIEKAFQNITKEGGKFYNATENQSKTTGARINSLKESYESLQLSVGLIFQNAVGGGISFLSTIISKAAQLVNWFREKWDALGRVFAPIINIFKKAGDIWQQVSDKISGVGSKGKMLENIFNAIGTALKFLEPVLNFITDILGQIVLGFVDFGIAAFNTVGKIIRVFSGLYSAVKEIFTGIGKLASDVFGAIGDMISGLLSGDFTKLSVGKDLLVEAFANKGKAIADAFRKGYDSTLLDFFGDDKKKEIGKAIFTKKNQNINGASTDSKEIAGRSKPVNITININHLIESFMVQAATLDQSAEQIKKLVVETILGAVNNANILARG